MTFILTGVNAKIFAKAIHTIAKFGDLYFEPDPDGLSIKAINSSKSAYCTFKFFDNFFSDYQYEESSENSFDGKCKLSIKTLLGIFKNMKQVDQCKISVDADKEKLIIEFNCKLDTRKNFVISILDVEVLQPGNIDNVDNRNKISGSTKIFSDISNNFQMAEEEITIEVESNCLIVKNYNEGQVIDQKFMRSQLKLKGEEFDVYSIKNEACITFCLREFRALLNFAETVNVDFTMFFEDGGMPVVFKVANLSIFEATLFMSTLSPDDITMIEDLNRSKRKKSSMNQTKSSEVGEINKHTEKPSDTLLDTLSVDDEDADITDADLLKLNLGSTTEISSSKNKSATEISPSKNRSANDEISKNDAIRNQESNRTSTFPLPVTLNISDDDSVTFVDNEINNDCVPSSPKSPPSKRARRLFKRCFEPTFIASDSDTVLALDSDVESN